MKRSLVLITLATLGVAACDDGTIEPLMETLDLTFSGLDPLANGFHYEGWAIIDGAPESTGKFNVDAGGGLTTVDGTPIPGGTFETGIDLMSTAKIVLTIEPAGDMDTMPSGTKVLAGAVSGGMAALVASDDAALGNDFASAAGDYILATPTNGAMNDENSGIWFLSLATMMPTVGLTLPTLPAGWAYEGWAVIDGQPVTSGTFTAVDMADDADPFSSTMPGPPFPGEDYLLNAPGTLSFPTDLAGGVAVISIEPQPDDSPMPFTLKPLVGNIPVGALDHVTYSMMNMVGGTFPTGTATIR